MRTYGTIALLAAAALFAVFFTNVSLGAFKGAPFLNDVMEMTTLLAASAVFVIAVLLREADRKAGSD